MEARFRMRWAEWSEDINIRSINALHMKDQQLVDQLPNEEQGQISSADEIEVHPPRPPRDGQAQ